jgi:glycogen(starch) synthase
MQMRGDLKRIALFASAFHPSLGGVEELVRQLALEYQRRGLEVVVVTNRWPRNLPVCEQIGGVSVRRYPLRLPDGGMRARWGFRFTAQQIFRDLVSTLSDFNPDVVHVQCVSANGWYAARVASHLGVPLVVSSQGERTMDAAGIYQRSPVMNRVLLQALASAGYITACSCDTLQDLKKFAPGYVFNGNSRVVYNGIGEEAFVGGIPSPEKRPFILALGRLVPQKGFHLLIEAMARAGLEGVDLVIGGDGEEFARLKSEIAKHRIEDRVRLTGRLDRNRVHALMRASIGVVVPSLREPMGIVVLEALAAGKPLVLSRVDGIPEIAPEGPGVCWVQPGRMDELSAGLRWLQGFCGSPPLRDHIRHARGFHWEKIADDYLEIYRHCREDWCGRARPPVASESNPMRGRHSVPVLGK